MVTSNTLQMLSTIIMYLGMLKDITGLVITAVRIVPTVALNFEL